MDVAHPTPGLAVEDVQQYAQLVGIFPTIKIPTEANDEDKIDIEAHGLLMRNPQVFGLVQAMAPYEPIVYARKGDRTVMGILSPNYDEQGENRLPSIKVLPLQRAYPLISSRGNLLPNAQMATMLAGSAHAEGPGSGSHNRPPSEDFEHKLTFLGALSLNRETIKGTDGSHVQHTIRRKSSVAAGLSNGQLGNIFVPNGDGDFPGYDMPLVFEPGKALGSDAIYFPKGFLEHPEAYGVYYTDAARIAYGASLEILRQRRGQQVVSEQMRRIGENS